MVKLALISIFLILLSANCQSFEKKSLCLKKTAELVPLISKLDMATRLALQYNDPSYVYKYLNNLLEFAEKHYYVCDFPGSKYRLQASSISLPIKEGKSCSDSLNQVSEVIKGIKVADGIFGFLEAANQIMDLYPQVTSDCHLVPVETDQVPATLAPETVPGRVVPEDLKQVEEIRPQNSIFNKLEALKKKQLDKESSVASQVSDDKNSSVFDVANKDSSDDSSDSSDSSSSSSSSSSHKSDENSRESSSLEYFNMNPMPEF